MKIIIGLFRLSFLALAVLLVVFICAEPAQQKQYASVVQALAQKYDISFLLPKPGAEDEQRHTAVQGQVEGAAGNKGSRLQGHTEMVCGPSGGEITTTERVVYQWEDIHGKTHISDRAPKAGQYQNLRSQAFSSQNLFSLSIHAEQAGLPPFARDKFDAQIRQIYQTLAKDIGVAQLSHTKVSLRLFDERTAYDAYQQQVAPTLGTTGGFYSSKRQEAVVYSGDYEQQTFAVTRHEMTHGILWQMFGAVPIWFNEGMAEYFETMQLTGQQRRFDINVRHQQQVQGWLASGASLVDYWQLDHGQWYQDGKKADHYALAWSLVFFLLSSKDHHEFTRQMMDQWALNYCEPFDAVAYFNRNYQGGMTGFESRWRAWADQPMTMAAQYY